ncbi:hypothetical protein AB835_14560 [Candidatus Endobugula sertula]|uniref:Uncharacterized protein n=1 Tax=Candidatus Endobugula sertula TaxID=62101 RepID=A0A1D2QLC0_9GAMM|nr:hypothetical protein AB835_14560 [Candidatus Endobugula sertula]
MISSKLILFFCFYLLLLDNSLGGRTILEQDKNKKLLKKANEYGETYGGELEQLGSQWKQLLLQIIQAKRKVGLGKAQLARFNESAAEEVKLVKRDTDADKVAELVAIRAQDIGTTQKYIDDLEILKNEIALTMIVEMDEIKEQFKENNVRRKVKEAKENGITDTDIKEILFADFFDSQGGLSLIDKAASIAKALLSSFRDGMECILYGTYYKKLGILEYGNIFGVGFMLDDSDTEDSDTDNNDAGENHGSRFRPVLVSLEDTGGGDPPGGGGDPPGGGGGDPPGGGDEPSGEESDDDEDDDEDDDDDEYINIFREFQVEFEDRAKDFDERLFRETGGETGHSVEGLSQFNREQANEARQAVDYYMGTNLNMGQYLEDQSNELAAEVMNVFESDPSLQVPFDRDLNDTDRLALFKRHVNVMKTYLERLDFLYINFLDLRDQLLKQLNITRQNVIYYGGLAGGDVSAIRDSLKPDSMPPELLEFKRIPANNARRYLVSGTRLNALIDFRMDLIDLFDFFISLKEDMNEKYNSDLAMINELENPPPS